MNTNQIARIAGMVGEPARAAMLIELMDGRALTATELARAAGVSAPTASAHLAQLLDTQMLHVTPAGRHRYYRLASAEVARLLETMMQVASKAHGSAQTRIVAGPKDAALRAARTCYDHLAGRLGVAITQRLRVDDGLVLDDERAYLTDEGHRAMVKFGIDPANTIGPRGKPAALTCRPCLDWSERRFHIAGRLAARICNHCLDQGWLRRRPQSRALDITPAGQTALQRWLGMELWRDLAP